MKKLGALFAICSLPMMAVSVSILGQTQTQALMSISGFTGPCTILLSESNSYSPLHPDVNGSEYPGADKDTGRPDTLTQNSGATHIVTLGHRSGDRALAVETIYYYQVSGCGETVSGSFTTPTLSQGTTRTDYFGFDSTKWGNLDIPAFDWTTSKTYVDPRTGARMIPMALHTATWRTGGGGSGPASTSNAFTDWSGGVGWTNPGTILNGVTSTASTANTNSIDLYPDLAGLPVPIMPYDVHRTLEDIGVVPYGGVTGDLAAADRQFTAALMVHGNACGVQTITATHGSLAQIRSGSSDPDQPFPSAFPKSPFYGWSGSTSPCLHQEDMEVSGVLSVSGTILKISGPSPTNHFSSALVSGDKIWIQGSSCPNSLCTIASVQNPGQATILENPGVSGNANYRAYGWWIRIAKLTSNGSLTVGLKYKLAGSTNPIGAQPGGDKCNINSFTSGDGKTGYLCQLTAENNFVGYLVFVADDGTVRFLTGGYFVPIGFDDIQNNTLYQSQTNASNSYTIQRIQYIGNATENIDFAYGCSADGGCPNWDNNMCDYPMRFTCTDLMPHASHADLQQQIAARQGTSLPAYNFSLYGNWTTNGTIGFYGTSGHFATWCNVYSGQGQWPAGGGPGWCAIADLSTTPYAVVTYLVHTLDGSGISNLRFGSLHSTQALQSRPNTFFFSLDPVQTATKVLHGGPFQAQVQQVLLSDGVTWSSNTCLPGLDGSGSCPQSLYTTCPEAGSSVYGANGCITVRLPQGGVCNVSPSSAEYMTFPHCPWSPGDATQFPLMQAGDTAVDLNTPGPGAGTQSEEFRVLSTATDGSALRVVLARNAVYYYCSFSPWHGQTNPYAAQQPNQTQHMNGWSLTMMPGTKQSCGAGNMFWDASIGGTAKEVPFGDHWATGTNRNGINFVTASEVIYDCPWEKFDQIPPVFNSLQFYFHNPASSCMGNYLCQSYPDDSQFAQGSAGYRFAFDTNALLGWSSRTWNPVVGTSNVYTISPSTPSGQISVSGTSYKIYGINGSAGRYQLKDVSGPVTCGALCQVDSQPFSMCFANTAGECHSGSAANQVYINVPEAFDRAPNLCETSQNWYNNPCIYLAVDGPVDSVRQFRIAANDSNGAFSRALSFGMSSAGRNIPYTHSTALPLGNWIMQMGTHYQDGFGLVPWLIKVPSWQESSTTGGDFIQYPVAAGAGASFAEIRFGYGRYGAPPTAFQCSQRTEACNTRNDTSSVPYNYVSEGRSLTPCASGCTINVPVVGPDILYYQVWRSGDGSSWSAEGDIQTVAVGAPRPPLCSCVLTRTSAEVGAHGLTEGVAITVTPTKCALTATSDSPWLHVAGIGSASITYTVDDNSGAARNGSLGLYDNNGQLMATFTVNQAAGLAVSLVNLGVWRPSDGTWNMRPASGPAWIKQWGLPGDVPVAGDVDGNGILDYIVWRPSTGTWYVTLDNGTMLPPRTGGISGDVPMAADYDGDGKTDFAVWRPSTGTWYVILSSTGTQMVKQWGRSSDVPVVGDFDGDGKADLAVWRPTEGNWYILLSSTGTVVVRQWGLEGDIPLLADFDGDGKADLAVWRPTEGNWYIIPSRTGTAYVHQWGLEGDIPVPRDYDHDGKADYAVWRPLTGTWHVIPSATPGAPQAVQWGLSADMPIYMPPGGDPRNTRLSENSRRSQDRMARRSISGHNFFCQLSSAVQTR